MRATLTVRPGPDPHDRTLTVRCRHHETTVTYHDGAAAQGVTLSDLERCAVAAHDRATACSCTRGLTIEHEPSRSPVIHDRNDAEAPAIGDRIAAAETPRADTGEGAVESSKSTVRRPRAGSERLALRSGALSKED